MRTDHTMFTQARRTIQTSDLVGNTRLTPSHWDVAFEDATVSVIIQCKTSCACGGGGPVCQANSHDLKVSQPNEPAEIEAEQMASRVTQMSV